MRNIEIEKQRQEILNALGSGVPDRVLEGVLRALDFQVEQETTNALAPGLNSDTRHYNAGRAAALEDYRVFLLALSRQAFPGRV